MKLRKEILIGSGLLVATCSLLLLLTNCDSSGEIPSTSVTIKGDIVDAYNNGRFVVWVPKSDDESQGQGAMMMSASSTSGSSSIEDTIDIIAEAPVNADGSFSVSTSVPEPRKVYFYILDATSADGQKLAPTKGQQFILEPGELNFEMNEHRQFTVSGGYFNDEVINSWKLNADYVQIQDELEGVRVSPDGESEEHRRARQDQLSELSSKLLDLEVDGLSQLATSHDDPIVRKLALQISWLVSDWYWEALVNLAEVLPEDQWVQSNAIAARDRIVMESAQAKVAVGTNILDFTAEKLSGESVTLTELQEEKSLVLLEFWASWCGPCRVEIPHMKKAYERFKDKGFEIVSFTIDDSKEDWELASEEEELPWPNLGMGQEAEAATKYSITGVPANYLFDARTGTIVARDLRGNKLDEVLEEKLL